jgi:hypothetical protein
MVFIYATRSAIARFSTAACADFLHTARANGSGKETLGHNDHMQGKGASPRPACGIRRGLLGQTSLHA